MVLRIIYTIFLGIILATFVGVGIAAFYPSPKDPEPPLAVKYPCDLSKNETINAEMRLEQEKYDRTYQDFQTTISAYNKNVSILALTAAILLLVISLTFVRKILILADGLLLGSVLSLLYSIGRGFATQDNMFRFIVVSVGLVVALTLGYLKFLKNSPSLKH